MRTHSIHLILMVFLTIGSGLAQNAPPATNPKPQKAGALAEEFHLEGERFSESCGGFKSPAGCAQVLFTDHPLHIAIGSIAPQNGIAAGLALVTHHDARTWYFKGNFDAVGSVNGSWRAGAYLKFIPTAGRGVSVSKPGQKSHGKIVARPLFTIYAQAITLNKLGFFGLGPTTTLSGKSYFGMQQTIVGSHAIVPMPWSGKLNLSLVGEVNGRFVDIRGSHGESSPSIEQLYTPVTAPGLASQPGFIQFGEGARIKPGWEHLHLNYLATFQQFVAAGNSGFSFRRLNLDLGHEIPFYQNRFTAPKDSNGPDDCGSDISKPACPTIRESYSRNRTGTLDLRFLLTESIASGGSVVPFYFQPTLGGSDVNGTAALPSFQDYRFRAPNLMLFHAGVEHSIWGPFGLTFAAETGKVTAARGDISLDHLSHSFAGGLTLRAGGFPMVYLMFAWGGHEGTHTIVNMNTALLGGSPRPSLF